MITKKQQDLLAAYDSLPSDQQHALEVLSVVYRPVSRASAQEFFNRAGVRMPQGGKSAYAGANAVVRSLLGKALLVQKERQVKCNPEIVEAVTRAADREGRLPKWVNAVNVLIPQREYVALGYFYFSRADDLIDCLRIALHLNEPERYERLLSVWNDKFADRIDSVDLYYELFERPFDGEWLYTRDPSIRDDALSVLIWKAHRLLTPSAELFDLLRRVFEDPDGAGARLGFAVEHELLVGNLEKASELLHEDNTSTGELFKGWACCLRGEHDAALSHYDASIRLFRKAMRKRDILLPALAGTFYVFALVATGDHRRIAQAHKYIDLASRNRPHNHVLHAALKSAVFLAEGKIEMSRELVVSYAEPNAEPPLHKLFIYTVLCWVDEASARNACRVIPALERHAKSNGYPWAAAEFGRIANRVCPGRSESAAPLSEGEGAGIAPLLDTIRVQAPWERSLAALERLSDSVADGSESKASARMTWRISVSRGSAEIAPFEQKLGKSGRWSRGRAVSLKRLHSQTKLDYLTAQDFKVCGAIETERYSYRQVEYRIRGDKALEALIGHPLVFRADSPETKVEIVRDDPHLQVETEGNRVRIELVPEPPGFSDIVADVLSPTRVTVSVFGKKHREIFAVLGGRGLHVPAESKEAVARAVSSVSSLVTVHSDIGGGDVGAAEKAADPTPQIHLTPYDEGLRAEPLVRPFAGEGPAYHPGEGGRVVFAIIGGQRVQTRRDMQEETRRFEAAVSSCPALKNAGWDGTAWILADPQDSLELLEQLQLLGDRLIVAWPRGEQMRLRDVVNVDRLSLKIRKSRDWFGIDGSVELDSGLVMSLRELIDRVKEAPGRFIPLGDKEFVALSDRFRKRVDELADYAERQGKGMRFHPSRAHALEALVEDAGTVDADDHWAKQVARFRQAQMLEAAVPSTLQAQLRDYQVEGFRWAARLAALGAGACLADDMGLGKTIQALAVAVSRAPQGPSLVVAPTSVCANWIDEARRFAPTLAPVQFGHGNRERMLQGLKPFDLVVCSYGLLHQEADGLAAVNWETVVLDEAQAIKNRETLRSRAAMRLVGAFRMITTGTPIENHLGELWNLFQFVNPGLLGSSDSFNAKFAGPIHQRGSSDARTRLKRLIQPFILRRTKTAVLDELPARTEITQRIEMTREERALYEAMRVRAVESLEAGDDEARGSHVKILAEITRLRRACCHPQLVMPGTDITGSKLERFLETVAELLDNGHKALVFSQFVGHLAIVRSHLDRQGLHYRYLDGSTPARDRKREVDAFQSGDGDLFLISLRAGGQGLNLTAADYVIHLDPWWNPAVEDQASDRAHRIGQTRPVTIYRLVMKDTIEEKIVGLHGSKRDLADNLLDGADMSGKMSADELLALIREA